METYYFIAEKQAPTQEVLEREGTIFVYARPGQEFIPVGMYALNRVVASEGSSLEVNHMAGRIIKDALEGIALGQKDSLNIKLPNRISISLEY